jgi:hypothetical protein
MSRWLHEYQTLLTGFIALAAAAIAYRSVREQTTQADNAFWERLKREELAARAVLPLTLSSLAQYAEECAQAVQSLLPSDPKQTWVDDRLAAIPLLPEGAIPNLTAVIESATPTAGQRLADLVAALQVQRARLLGCVDRRDGHVLSAHDLLQRLVEAGELYAGIAGAFDYARRRSNAIDLDLTSSRVRQALHNCGVWDTSGFEYLLGHWSLENSIYRLTLKG